MQGSVLKLFSHRPCVCRVALAFAAVLLCATAGADEWTMGQLLVGLNAAQRGMPPFKIRDVAQERRRIEGIDARELSCRVVREYVCDAPQDPMGRFKCLYEFNDPQIEAHVHQSAVWDGRVLRSVRTTTGQRDGGVTLGTVCAEVAVAHRGPPPQEFLWCLQYHTIAQLIDRFGGAISRWEGDGSSRVAVIESPPLGNEGRGKYRFDVAPALGFAVVYRAGLLLVDMDGTLQWHPQYEIACTDYHQAQEGIWLPRRASSVFWVFPEAGPQLGWQISHKLTWELHPQVPEDAFELEFPLAPMCTTGLAASDTR